LAEELVVVAEEEVEAAAVVEEAVETLPFFGFVFLVIVNGNEKE